MNLLPAGALALTLLVGPIVELRTSAVAHGATSGCIVRWPATPGGSRVAGFPSHQAWPLPTGAHHRWVPAALDANYVLMYRQTQYGQAETFYTAQPIRYVQPASRADRTSGFCTVVRSVIRAML